MAETKQAFPIVTRLGANPTICHFESDREIHAGDSYFFRSPDDAAKAPLAKKIFGISGIETIKIGGSAVTVTRDTPKDWPSVTRAVAGLIAEQLDSGEPAIEKGAPTNMRTPEEIKKLATEVLDREINPAVASHGGVISILDVKGTTIYVKMGGGCQGCGQASMTLKSGVEQAFRKVLPELDEVLDTTDHAGGTNPYYAPSGK